MLKHVWISIGLIALCSQRVDSGTYDNLFNEICSLVDNNFYDSTFGGIDWPTIKQTYKKNALSASTSITFATVVNGMLSKLNASHTNYYTADDPVYYQLADIFSAVPPYKPAICKAFTDCVIKYTDIGIITQQIETDFFVKAVLDSSPAYNAGIFKGDRIISVDDIPYKPILAFKNKANTNVTIKIQRTTNKSSIKSFAVKPVEYIPNEMFENAMRKSAKVISHKGIDVGYVHVWSFAGERYYEVLKEIITMQFSSAKALVIDLRYGPGGANPEYLNIFNDRVPVLINKLRNGQGWTHDPQWRKPVVLSDGSMLYLAGVNCLVNGENLEGKGVMPDIEVPQELKYCAGKDIQLDKAIEIAAKEIQ